MLRGYIVKDGKDRGDFMYRDLNIYLRMIILSLNQKHFFMKPMVRVPAQSRSPIRIPQPSLSPYTKSPPPNLFHGNRDNLSPLRNKINSPNCRTPLKTMRQGFERDSNLIKTNGQFFTSKKIKKGEGLFQQLVNEKKYCSDKKSGKLQSCANQNSQPKPFELSNFRKKFSVQTEPNQNFCFANLIKNIQQIDSVEYLRKTKSNKEENSNKKLQKQGKIFNVEHVNSIRGTKVSEIESSKEAHILVQEIEDVICIQEENEQIQDSFSEINMMLGKAGEQIQNSSVMEDSVKISITEQDVSNFSMSPFI